MTRQMIAQELVRIASLLDDAGLKREADVLDGVLGRVASQDARTASLESNLRGRLNNIQDRAREMSYRLQDPNLSEEKRFMIGLEQKMLAAQIETIRTEMDNRGISTDPYDQWGEDAHWMRRQEDDYGMYDSGD